MNEIIYGWQLALLTHPLVLDGVILGDTVYRRQNVHQKPFQLGGFHVVRHCRKET
jgi:hypothetical protein